MAELYTLTLSAVAPGASVTKGVLYIPAPSTQSFRLAGLDISMDGSTTTNFWPLFELLIYSGAFTAPTGGTAITSNKGNGEAQNKTALVTGAKKGTFTAEITGGSSFVAKSIYLPSGSAYPVQWPLGREGIYVPPSSAIYLHAITPASFAQNIAVNAEIEE